MSLINFYSGSATSGNKEKLFWHLLVFLLFLSLTCITACARDLTPKREDTALSADDKTEKLPPVWSALEKQLQKSGISGPEVTRLLATLPAQPTQSPMGRKIRELYNKQFFPKSSSKSQSPYYKGVLTQENAELCRNYIKLHQAAFNAAYEKYGVSPAMASSLLFVETRLGKVLGDVPENAFYTLASMAMSKQPSDISSWLDKMHGYQNHTGWLNATMQKRSDWAYNEFKALIKHMLKDNIPPERLPGSIYGAVGLCQFMPSNISSYGADGNGDGRIDLFTDSDSIASLANYLYKHGWRKGLDEAQKHHLLMTYNHSKVYANTILALSHLVEDPGLNPEYFTKTATNVRKKK